ncbi:MAG: MgtC/SapB family protein [Candidatus Brocadiaceae bacterium]|jgi:putative Mg2+ transporter-C (MgtC) family protein
MTVVHVLAASGGLSLHIFARIALAAVLGGTIGWERERHGRAAGVRTHMLLGIGCALIMLVSLHVPEVFAGRSAEGIVRADPGRIAGHALSGLGFLGAGAIIVLGTKIRGLTTAASIWVTAALGLAIGAGYAVPALFAWLLTMFALLAVTRLEHAMEKKDRYVTLALTFHAPGQRLGTLRSLLRPHSFAIIKCTTDRHEQEVVYDLVLRYQRDVNFEQVTNELDDALHEDGLTRIEWGE